MTSPTPDDSFLKALEFVLGPTAFDGDPSRPEPLGLLSVMGIDEDAMCDCGEVLSDDDLRSDARECGNCRNPWERDNRNEDRLS